MAISNFDFKSRVHFGPKRVHIVEFDFDSSYPTNGEPLTASDLLMHKVELLIASPKLGFSFAYDYSASKIKVYCPGIVVAAAGSATLDDYALTGVAATTTASIALDNATGAGTKSFGGQIEVPNTSDLSTLTDVRAMVVGY